VKRIILHLFSIITCCFLAACANSMSFVPVQVSPSVKNTPVLLAPSEIYTDFRNRIFSLHPQELGISHTENGPNVWAVVMETSINNGYVTLVYLADGTTNLYFGNGGGILDGGRSTFVAQSTKAFIEMAEKHYQQMSVTEAFPLPADGKVKFYIFTFSGIFTSETDESKLMEGQHLLSPLFSSGQDVITRLFGSGQEVVSDLQVAEEQLKNK